MMCLTKSTDLAERRVAAEAAPLQLLMVKRMSKKADARKFQSRLLRPCCQQLAVNMSRGSGGAAGIRPGSQGCSESALHPAGVLTETTAELAAALTLAAARRVVEADRFMRGGHYKGWLPDLFVGSLLQAPPLPHPACHVGLGLG